MDNVNGSGGADTDVKILEAMLHKATITYVRASTNGITCYLKLDSGVCIHIDDDGSLTSIEEGE